MTIRRRRRSTRARLLAALGSLALAVVLAAPGIAGAQTAPVADDGVPAGDAPVGGVGIALAEAPTDRADDPRARSAIVDHVEPGDVVRRAVRITNTTAETVQVSTYANAATVEDGVWKPADGRIQNELSGWTAVEPAVVTVPAFGQAVATVSIVVPADAGDGERYATVWAEQPGVVSDGLRVVNRAGVRIYLSVGDGDEPASAFTIGEIRALRLSDGVHIEADVANTGGRALDLNASALLEDLIASVRAGPFAATATTAGLGQAVTMRIPLPDRTAPGPWQTALTVHAGLLRQTQIAELTIPSTVGTYTVAGDPRERPIPGEGFTPAPPPPTTTAPPDATPVRADAEVAAPGPTPAVAAPVTSPATMDALMAVALAALATVVGSGAFVLLRPRLSTLRSPTR